MRQFKNFVNDRLIFGKKPISADIQTNKFKIWDFSVTDVEKPFAPTDSIINKIWSASEHRTEIIVKYEIVDVAQSLDSTSDTAYHGKKSNIMKHLPPFSLLYFQNKESNAAIIIKMSPVICKKCVSVTSNVDCFSGLAVVIFYHVQSLTSSVDKNDSVFDQYFEKSLIVDTSKGLGLGSSFVFTGNTKLPCKMAEDFLMHSANKSNFIEFLSKNFYYLYRGDQIYILSYRDSVLTNHPEHPVIIRLWWRFIYHKMPVWRIQLTGDMSYITLCWPTDLQADRCSNYWHWCSHSSDIVFRRFHILWHFSRQCLHWDDKQFYLLWYWKNHCISQIRHMQSIVFLLKRGTRGSTVSTKILTPIYFQN